MSNTIRHYYNAAYTSASNYYNQKEKDAQIWLYSSQKWRQVAKGIACFMGSFAFEAFVLYQAEKWGYCQARKILKDAFSPIPPQELENVNKVGIAIAGVFITLGNCVLTPIMEEVLFRDIIQKNILGTNTPQSPSQKKAPSKLHIVATKITKITVTACAFSLWHYGVAPTREQRIFHHISTFAMGIGFGITMEVCGLFCSVIVHSARNLTAMTAFWLLRFPSRAYSLIIIPPILLSACAVKLAGYSIREDVADVRKHSEYIQSYQTAIPNLEKLKRMSPSSERDAQLLEICGALMDAPKNLKLIKQGLLNCVTASVVDLTQDKKEPFDEGLDKLILAAQNVLDHLIFLQTIDKQPENGRIEQ